MCRETVYAALDLARVVPFDRSSILEKSILHLDQS